MLGIRLCTSVLTPVGQSLCPTSVWAHSCGILLAPSVGPDASASESYARGGGLTAGGGAARWPSVLDGAGLAAWGAGPPWGLRWGGAVGGWGGGGVAPGGAGAWLARGLRMSSPGFHTRVLELGSTHPRGAGLPPRLQPGPWQHSELASGSRREGLSPFFVLILA